MIRSRVKFAATRTLERDEGAVHYAVILRDRFGVDLATLAGTEGRRSPWSPPAPTSLESAAASLPSALRSPMRG